MDTNPIDLTDVFRHLLRLGTAYLLAMPIAWDREAHSGGAGLRTFPLVALASCAYVLLGIEVLDGADSQSRVLYGLMTGMGFIGGGAILKDGGSVRGTATAASIWNTGAIGAAVAWNRYEMAITLALLNFITLWAFRPLKRAARDTQESLPQPAPHEAPGGASVLPPRRERARG
ncbi:MAG TPA: MgtC/SapB family protein [Candidatus Binatia bacterium]|nr:MgtC/SapB family protein [Candidatus Binatia bacterium]